MDKCMKDIIRTFTPQKSESLYLVQATQFINDEIATVRAYCVIYHGPNS